MELRDKNILIISNEAWGSVWFSKHNYAHELSRNNRVIFVDPAGPWRPANLLGSAPSITPIGENLSVLRYRNRLPVLNKWFYKLNERLVARSVKRELRRSGNPTDVLITFDPTRFTTPRAAGEVAAAESTQFRPGQDVILAAGEAGVSNVVPLRAGIDLDTDTLLARLPAPAATSVDDPLRSLDLLALSIDTTGLEPAQ